MSARAKELHKLLGCVNLNLPARDGPLGKRHCGRQAAFDNADRFRTNRSTPLRFGGFAQTELMQLRCRGGENAIVKLSMSAPESRFVKACRALPVDRTPVWFMRQAGRYMPEYRAVRKQHSLIEICKRPEVAAE